MRWLWAVLGLVVGTVALASADSFTMNLSDDREAVLKAQLSQPTIFTIKGAAPKTRQQYIEDLVNYHLDRIIDADDERNARDQIRAKREKGKK